MVRKKKGINNRIIAGIIGAVVIIAVVIPVLFIVTGFGDSKILPQDTTPELEIPFEQPPPPVLPPSLTADEIDDLINNPNLCINNPSDPACNVESLCEIEQSELQKIAECEVLTLDEVLTELDPSLTVDECSQVNRPSAEQCDVQIDEFIQQILADSEPIEQPIPPNETSIDDPFTQICDQNPDLIVCGESRSLELLTTILKIDSAGVQTTVETTTGIPRLSFFVEDTTNIDFRTGQLQFEIQIKGDPNLSYIGNGKVDLLIGEQSIFTEPINVEVDGIADAEGKVDLSFISPTGIPSQVIFFDFEDNLDKFPDESVTSVRLHVVELNIAGERDQDFALLNEDVFTMNIARDETKILITDEEGVTTRVYPSDSILNISPRTSTSEEVLTGTTRTRTYDSIFHGNGRGCSQFMLISDVSSTASTPRTTTVPAPNLSGISITDSEGMVVGTGSGSFSITDLTRNDNYTINISQQNIQSSPLEYGKSQETKSYVCTQNGIPNTQGFSTTSGNTGICGYYTVRSGITLSGTVTVTPNSVTCNFPQETP